MLVQCAVRLPVSHQIGTSDVIMNLWVAEYNVYNDGQCPVF